MNCWQILQIPPTSDTKAIRKAYAKLLKTTRPDDDAAAYQALREAFDEALRIAPYQNDTPPENPPETDFRQPETAQTASNPECAAWIARVQSIIAQDGIVGVLRERQSLSEQIWETTPYDQRDEAALFWLNFLREQSHYSPYLWNFGASWFGWWDDDQQLLTEAEFNRLHAKQDDADCVSSPENLWQHLQEWDKNGSDLWALWQQFPYEIQSFTDDENRKLGILLNAWRERDDLPEKLRQEWQTRYPEFSGSLKSDEIAEIDDKLAHLRALFAENGVAGVWAVHAETEKWLDNLPPLAQPLVAKQLLDLLREWQTRSPHLWAAWGLRFGWRDNVWLNTELSDDEIEHFYYQKHLTDFYHNISELADFLDHAYQHMGDGQTEIGYLWAVYQADIFMLSETELAQLHALMLHYLQHFPHRLPENVFNDWYARTQGETAFRQPETLENAEITVPQYDFSGSTELSPQDVRAFIDRIYAENQRQSHHLIDKWDEIRALIQKLPLGNDERVSYLLLDFLRENKIFLPRIWSQWGKYFGWHNDYRVSQMLSHDELELLQKYMNIAELQSPDFRQPDTSTRYPISRALSDLAHKGKRGKAVFAALILQSEWEREVPSEQRKSLFGDSDLSRIDGRVDNLRMVYLALLVTLSFGVLFSNGNLAVDLLALLMFLSAAAVIFYYAHMMFLGLMNQISSKFTEKMLNLHALSVGQMVFGIGLPILLMVVAHFNVQNQHEVLADNALWLILIGTTLSWNVNVYRIDDIKFSRWWLVQAALLGGFLFTLDSAEIKGDTPSQFWGMDVGLMSEPYFALWAMILWLNTSVLLKQICDQRGWLNNPVAQTLLFLPAVVLQYSKRVSGIQVWQWLCWHSLAFGAMAWILPYPQVWLAFYPVLFTLIAAAFALKSWAKRQLDV